MLAVHLHSAHAANRVRLRVAKIFDPPGAMRKRWLGPGGWGRRENIWDVTNAGVACDALAKLRGEDQRTQNIRESCEKAFDKSQFKVKGSGILGYRGRLGGGMLG